MEGEVVSRVRKVIRQAKSRGMTNKQITECFKANGYSPLIPGTASTSDKWTDQQELNPYKKSCLILNCMIFKVYPIIFGLLLLSYPLVRMMAGYACLLSEVSPFGEAVTPVVSCEICEGVTGAPKLNNISMDDFVRNHAYTSKPVLVEGAVSNWSALRVFSYEYFKSLYVNSPESLEDDNSKGQFFAYSSNIRDLKDLFSLPSEVATMEAEKWYIGWSTSDPVIGEALKKHVSVPYFIPPGLAGLHMSWIFMGSPGPGANIHIDMVGLPSWQAQLRGKKTWTLHPPPECEHVCKGFNVTMNTGDVLVVDTNKWYHQTYIHPGSISITIGSEFG